MNEAYLLTGGNMDDRKAYLQKAKKEIVKRCGHVVKLSSVYETAAWGNENQQAFLNQVMKIETDLEPASLLHHILEIESELGRTRDEKYGPRTIDIDILLFNNEVINRPGLKIPHPQMPNRRFVLTPLNEIAPDTVHPVLQKTIAQILAECTDPLSVNKIS